MKPASIGCLLAGCCVVFGKMLDFTKLTRKHGVKPGRSLEETAARMMVVLTQ